MAELIKIIKNKFSYTKLNTYENCPFNYWLKYDQKKYIYVDTLAAELGTLIHHIEETIATSLISGFVPDYDELKDEFMNINIPKTSPYDMDGGIFGLNVLKKKYKEEFYEINDNGESYFTKANEYMNKGIYRLENYMNEHPTWKLIDVEKYFEVEYNNVIFYGYIDRILQDTTSGEYIIEDIKTKDHAFEDKDLATPLQFVVYSIALKKAFNLEDYPTICYYDLPICNIRQKAGTSGFIKRGMKKLDSILESIKNKNWQPKPSPLCHWCDFCNTNPKQTEEGKNLCCYYSLWTRNNKTYETIHSWEGIENHEKVLSLFKQEQCGPDKTYISFDFDF